MHMTRREKCSTFSSCSKNFRACILLLGPGHRSTKTIDGGSFGEIVAKCIQANNCN